MRSLIFFIILALTFSSCGVFLQRAGMKNYTPIKKISEKGLNDYQYDFLYMTQLLEEGFPKLDSIFPKGERKKLKSIALDRLGKPNATKKDFKFLGQKYVGSVHNQHTSLYLKVKYDDFYPFKVFNSYGKLYLRNIARNQDSLLIGKEIVEMNGFPIGEVQKRLKRFSFSENEIGQLADLRWGWYYYNVDYLIEIGVVHSYKDVLKIKFKDGNLVELRSVKSKELNFYSLKELPHPLTRHRKEIYSYHIFPEANLGYLQFLACHDRDDLFGGIQSYVKPWLQPVARAYVKRQMRKKKPSKRIANYYNQKYPVFKDFVWEMVDSLNRSGVEHLVIDLRRNGGGNLDLGIELLYFLTDRKDLQGFKEYAYTSAVYKKYFPSEYQMLLRNRTEVPDNQLVLKSDGQDFFAQEQNPKSDYYIPVGRPIFKGKIYVLANYQTGSAAAMLATLIQDNHLGTLIGTSVGNNASGPTSFTPMRLPKTKASFGEASTYLVRPDESKGAYQIPDYWVEYTIDDLITGRDPYLEKAMELIKASGMPKD